MKLLLRRRRHFCGFLDVKPDEVKLEVRGHNVQPMFVALRKHLEAEGYKIGFGRRQGKPREGKK